MNISIIGTGYVGLVSGTCFSEMGNDVTCVDVVQDKIDRLNNGIIPIYEPGLEEMVARNKKDGRLHFTTDYSKAIPQSDIAFIAVGTPPGEDGSADISYVLAAAKNIGEHINKYTVIVDKSTVPVGTSILVRKEIQKALDARGVQVEFSVVSNPEFLKEGVAIEDFMKPDRVVIGCDDEKSRQVMHRLYEPFVRSDNPVIFMDVKSAEITKYAANAMLATRISFMNEIAGLCEKIGGDIKMVRLGIGADNRIGKRFLYAGCGYGGSCFPKDVKELIAVGRRNGIEMKVAEAVEEVNHRQKHWISNKIFERFGTDLRGKTFALWGLAFKPQTDDMRESPAIEVVHDLVGAGAVIKAYDPQAFVQAHLYLSDIPEDHISYIDDQYAVTRQADALILLTEWKQFRSPDFNYLKSNLKNPVIVDGRNQYDGNALKQEGFDYYCVGRTF
ncbi:MAG: UDP-glucose/GDP-mannose dehydrogenase family protein [Treponema sp.]|nr:UDP-glucose/GDP-mannose dehydrogenase family protein [Treponema sp.]